MAGYEVVGRVASTRSGAVWKARDVALDRFVALKQVEPDGVEREAAALAALASEHIVEIYGVVHDGGDTYLAEQWVDGAPLSVVARTAGTMSPQQALGVVRGVLRGLVVTHAAGLVHGDVSLGNVLVAVDGHATLIDFGSVVRAGAAAGPSTGAFAAPEVRAGGAVSPASDVWSVAAVLVTLLQGTVSAAITTRGVDAGLRPVLDRALADAPTARYPDAAAFLAALEGAAERRYGTAWWTQAGLGALAAAGTAELLTPGEGAPFRGRPEALLGAAVIGAATPDPPVARPVADPVP
ncbi:MAG: serine/threonine-protein kinase, partial [Jatrophihabitans sp.]|uniref:serine/threonine-protein kinase n=1 Tax=Jatrophihabitans sp. TaxID=1932789 RepID=UPI003F7DCCFC